MANVGGMANKLGGGLTELRKRILFLVGALIVFRIGAFVPVPGVDSSVLAQLMEQQQGTLLALFNVFSGGALERASVFALGIMPYISASIIIQVMGFVYEPLKALKKEGEAGRRKLMQYTRYGTVLLALFQATSIALNFPNFAPGLVPNPGFAFYFGAVVSLVTGTMFLMWLGEQINERGIGNGISMLIFAGIVAGMPTALGQTFENVRQGELSFISLIILVAIVVVVTAVVIFIERGQRRLVVNYAKRQQGRKVFQAQQSHLPLKINMAGVIPAIFASSIILFPATLVQWFGGQGDGMVTGFLQDVSATLSPGQPLYLLLYAAGIIFFSFFYTAIVFNPRDIAENLKKSGAFLPAIRPGEHTAKYIDKVVTRLTLVGALYMTAVCLLPEAMIQIWNVPFYFGGTSLLIIVVVVMDFMAQVQAHLMSQQYESLLKKANFRGIGPAGQLRQN
ncbi:MAG: preprotein translocase subunit SecY [Pseudomonadota bacterium]